MVVAVDEESPAPSTRRWAWVATAVWANLLLFFAYQGSVHAWIQWPAARNWSTIFMATVFQALPFLLLGVIVGAAIATFVPGAAIARALPRRPALAVPVAGLAGVALPGCECSAAPVANRLIQRGVAPAAALTFLLSAPAINPVVIVSTAVAFPGQPEMAAARFGASLLVAVLVGWGWSRWGRAELVGAPEVVPETDRARDRALDRAPEHAAQCAVGTATCEPAPRARPVDTFVAAVTGDFVPAAAYLIMGAAFVATFRTVWPDTLFGGAGGSGLTAIAVMAALAVVMSVCSEADAFIAAGLTQFSLTSRLVFLVVGPMVDAKLVALQAGVFGRPFAVRFAPAVFATAVVVAAIVGTAVW